METQNVELDEQGRYTVLMGSTRSEGVPLELFTTGEPRWLGVELQLPGSEEEARVLLVSVPYALKAADAETLGGKPASAFALLAPEEQPAAGHSGTSPGRVGTLASGGPRTASVWGTGSTNKLTKWLDTAGTLGDSAVYEAGGLVGIGKTNPQDTLDVNGNLRLPELGAININTTFGNPLYLRAANGVNALLIVDDASGGAYGGLQIRKSGTAKVNISGGGLSPTYFNGGNVGIGTPAPTQKLEVVGNVKASGSVTGASFTGNGSGLTNLNATNLSSGTIANNLTTATSANTANTIVLRDGSGNFSAGTITASGNLTAAGSVSGGQLISTAPGQTPPLVVSSTTLVTNLNAALLNGLASTAFAPASGSAAYAPATGSTIYAAKANDTMVGTLNLPANGLVAGTNQLVLSGGSVGIGTATPGEKLEVAGNVKASGIVFLDGSVQTTSGLSASGPQGPINPEQVALLRWYGANQRRALPQPCARRLSPDCLQSAHLSLLAPPKKSSPRQSPLNRHGNRV